jgi:hypothetical protein
MADFKVLGQMAAEQMEAIEKDHPDGFICSATIIVGVHPDGEESEHYLRIRSDRNPLERLGIFNEMIIRTLQEHITFEEGPADDE